MILTDTKTLTHEEWLSWRQKGIGGSDAGAVCGLNPYRSAVDVWADKTSKSPIEIPDNEAMRVGRDLEDYVAKRFTEMTGKNVRRRNAMFQDPEYPFMLANVDRVVIGENALLECKTANAYGADKWTAERIPESYELQCHHYMAVTGTKKVYIACLIMGIDFVVREIERDESLIDDLRRIESDFWHKYVETREMPPPDGSDAAGEAILNMYPSSAADTSVDLIGFKDRLSRYDEIDALIGSLEREQAEIKQQIQLEMKDAETAYIGDRKVTWKSTKPRKTIDSKKLQEEMPEIYKSFLKEGKPSRRFTVSKKRED